jgi:nitroreductase/NAD-dependent dihydropyrimidine dehydrogenase PreA subunit
MSLIRVDVDKCERDGICVEVCPIGILSVNQEGRPSVRPGFAQHCIACGHCVAACPHGALDNVRNPLSHQGTVSRLPVMAPEKAFTFLRSRRSIRCYLEKPVPREALLKVLEIARYAPSGHNSQGLSYLVLDSRDSLRRVSELVTEWMKEVIRLQPELARQLNMPGIVKAQEKGEDRILRRTPGLIVATAPKGLRTAQITAYLALEYVELYATTLGLGTCWAGFAQVCAQQYPPLSEFLRIPEGQAVTGMMMLGYPKHLYHRLPERNPLEVKWFEEEAGSRRHSERGN